MIWLGVLLFAWFVWGWCHDDDIELPFLGIIIWFLVWGLLHGVGR